MYDSTNIKPIFLLPNSKLAIGFGKVFQITQVLNQAVRQLGDLETRIVAVERIQEYCELPSEVCVHRRGV